MGKKDEMEKVAKVFDEYELPKVAEEIRSLSNDLYEKKIILDFDEAWARIRDLFRDEFVSKPDADKSFKEKCYCAYTTLQVSAVRNDKSQVQQLFKDFESSMKRIGNSYKIISEVAQGLGRNPQLTSKQKYFGSCFAYMIIVEGVFKELFEIIYGLDLIRDGLPTNFHKIEKMPIATLANKIKSRSDLSVLIEGYWNFLRNSIAHAWFTYDETANKIDFKDVYRGRERNLGNYTLEEFVTNFYFKIDSL